MGLGRISWFHSVTWMTGIRVVRARISASLIPPRTVAPERAILAEGGTWAHDFLHVSDLPLVSLKIRLHHGDGFAMGPGKADLLEAILATQSIAAAGRRLGLSYWKTRHLLDEMSRSFRLPVVVTAKGGASGGGSQVTEIGRAALAAFRAMEAAAGAAIAGQVVAFQALLAERDGAGKPR